MRMEQLIVTLPDKSDEALVEFIQNMRDKRKAFKQNSKKPAAKRKKAVKNKMVNLFQTLTPEQKAQLMKDLQK